MHTRWLRGTDFDAFERVGYEFQILFNGEGARVIASSVGANGAAPPRHVHPVDQIYYVTEGEMHGILGSEPFVAGPDTLVFIPAGLPHHNWNEGDVHEFHFEVIAPTPHPKQQTMVLTDETDDGGRPYFVRSVGPDAPPVLELLGRSMGSEHMALHLERVEAGAGEADTHVHAFDQLLYVLEGELSAQVGVEALTVGAHQLVVIPAGVPHRTFNAGAAPVRRLAVTLGEPEAGEPWEIPVHFDAPAAGRV